MTILLFLLLVSGSRKVLAQSGTSSGPALVSIAVTPVKGLTLGGGGWPVEVEVRVEPMET